MRPTRILAPVLATVLTAGLTAQTWTDATPAARPTDGPDGQMVCDLLRNVHVYYGGRGPAGTNNDTWEYSSVQDTASYAFAGTGCGGSAPVLGAASGATPRSGQSFTMAVSNLSGTAVSAFISLGFTNMVPGLPLDLGVIRMSGCYVQCDTTAAFGVGIGAGTGTFTVQLPTSALGFQYWNQAAVLDPAADARGLPLSNAARGYIGT